MIVYAVREHVPYESDDVIKLFTTLEKAKTFAESNSLTEDYYELSVDQLEVE